jgi:hypothetical protein
MRKYFQLMNILGVVLVFCYVLLVVVALLLTLMLSGVRVSGVVQWVVIGGWVVFCFGSVYVRPGLNRLRRMELRTRRITILKAALAAAGLLPRVVVWVWRLGLFGLGLGLGLGSRFGRPIGWKVRVLILVLLGYLLYRLRLLGVVILFPVLDWIGAGVRWVLKKLEREYGGNFAGFE